jgi:hypothetical protein
LPHPPRQAPTPLQQLPVQFPMPVQQLRVQFPKPVQQLPMQVPVLAQHLPAQLPIPVQQPDMQSLVALQQSPPHFPMPPQHPCTQAPASQHLILQQGVLDASVGVGGSGCGGGFGRQQRRQRANQFSSLGSPAGNLWSSAASAPLLCLPSDRSRSSTIASARRPKASSTPWPSSAETEAKPASLWVATKERPSSGCTRFGGGGGGGPAPTAAAAAAAAAAGVAGSASSFAPTSNLQTPGGA